MVKRKRGNKIFILFLAAVLMLSMTPAVYAASSQGEIQLIVNGEEIKPDVPPQLINNRTMVPVRWVSEALGADVTWDAENQRVIIDSGLGVDVPAASAASSEIQLIVDGNVLNPDVPPQLVNNRTMVPVRWVSEALGADVVWDAENQTVRIDSANDGQTADGGVYIPNRYDEQFFLADDELFIFIENVGEFENESLLNRVLADKLKAAFPDMKLNIEVWDTPIRTSDLVDAGIVPDIYLATSREYIDIVLEKYGWEFDMTDLIENSNVDLSKMNQAAVELVKSRSDGGIYGVPIWISEHVLFYNTKIFDAFGQPYPTNGMTYDEIYELTPKVMGQAGVQTFKGITQHPDAYMNYNQLGLLPFEPTSSEHPTIEEIKASVNITTDDWLRVTENMYRFLAIPGNNFVSTDDFFTKQNYAMAVSGVHALKRFNSEGYMEENFKPGVVSVPVLSEEDNWTYQPNVLAAHVTKQSDKKEQAMEIIEWLLSDEAQLHFSRHMYKAVVESQEAIDQFAAEYEIIYNEIEGIGEAVYWGENAYVQNYKNTEFPDDRFPIWFVFRQNVLQDGNPPDVALRNAQDRDIANWYGWLPEDER